MTPERAKRFCVVRIADGRELWHGRSELQCAEEWRPGTFPGKGETYTEARKMAARYVARAQGGNQ